MSSAAQRVVVVRRRSAYEELLDAHGTRGAAEFFLRARGRTLEELDRAHALLDEARRVSLAAIPARWRRAEVVRDDLSRFLFEPDDVVVCVGQDGLVANVAKYLDGQVAIGVNPDATANEGVLVRHPPAAVAQLVREAASGTVDVEERTMVECTLDDGPRIVALNEIFVGHRSHQSARYVIRVGEREERQSSSGVVVVTGTGASGWGRSIRQAHRSELTLPSPTDASLAYFVREAWPSLRSGADLVEGRAAQVEILSELEDGGVCFGDGIEDDRLELGWGRTATIAVARERLRLA